MKVYDAPIEIGNPPRLNYSGDIRKEMKKEEAWIAKIKQWAKQHGNGTHKGREVRLPFADGYACYVIVDSKSLIHLPVGDAWNYPHIQHLPFNAVKQYAV